MKKQLLPALVAGLAILCQTAIFAQTQTLKGRVVDKAIRMELPGATVQISTPTGEIRGAATDENGQFRFEKLPVGKYALAVSFIGYKPAGVPNVALDAGKETDLVIELEEQVFTGNEAVIKATLEKEKPLNELSAVSTRTFSVDETKRFAAAFNDPARMASSFAGVVTALDGNNIICIRGNAPNGLLWRMEGVDIPNPNHFSALGTSGGGISILSAQVLGNSDFSTGAFAAEYGNATSGVFDLRMRRGNADRREFTVGASVLGFDFAAEGPMAGRRGGSYLVNYRYSTLSLLTKLGLPIEEVDKFQDLSYNVFLPAGRAGNFTVFGMGGLSSATFGGMADSAKWKDGFYKRYPFVFKANMGMSGITHSKTWGTKTWLKNIVAVSATENSTVSDRFLLPDYAKQRDYEVRGLQPKVTVSSVLSHRFNSRHYLRTGGYLNFLGYDFRQSAREDVEGPLLERIQRDGWTQSAQAFAQWQYRPTERVTFNAGLHSVFLFLNKTASVEPRASLKYAFSEKQSLTFGYGLHGQLQPLGLYFLKNENGELLNPDLGMSKSHHFVVADDWLLRKNLRVKTEAYFQKMFNVPVSRGRETSFSMLNNFADLPFDTLENTGRGRNYGVEITVEQFLTRGFYFLATTSLFRSEYRGSDLVWRNTLYDSRRAHTLTAGKEWNFNRRGRDRTLGLNLKLVSTGGHGYTPVDLEKSIEEGKEVLDESRAFSEKVPDYFRLDAGIKLKRNYRRVTSTVSLDVQNATNRKNVGGQYFDPEKLEVKFFTQAPLIPVLAYKVEF